MTKTLLLMLVAEGKKHEVIRGLCEIPEITYVHPVFGAYDMIAVAESLNAIAIQEKIRLIDGVHMVTSVLPRFKVQE